MSKQRRSYAIKNGYRSGLENRIAGQLSDAGVEARYEPLRIAYEPLQKIKSYTPDFLLPNGILIETKGRFMSADRQKHRAIKEQHPSLDIRFVFARPHQAINKGSKTTYAMWSERYGFQWADTWVPLKWIKEPTRKRRLQAIEKARKQ